MDDDPFNPFVRSRQEEHGRREAASQEEKIPITADKKRDSVPPPKKQYTYTDAGPVDGAGTSTGIRAAMDPAMSDERSRALQAKERELAEKERFLKEQEAHLTRRANWPKGCPFVYQNFQLDIEDPGLRKFAYRSYFLWITCSVISFLNFVSCIVYWTTGPSNGFQAFGLSLGYFVIGVPMSFFLWNRCFYNAWRKEKPTLFRLAEILLVLQILFGVVMILGVTDTGAAGFVMMISLFQSSDSVPAIFAAITCGLYLAWDIYAGWFLWRVHQYNVKAGVSGEIGLIKKVVEIAV